MLRSLRGAIVALVLLVISIAAGAQITVKQSSTSRNLVFIMIDSSDHVTGKTGLTVTVTLSKNGGAFAAPAGTVTEVANGEYKLAPTSADTGTLGALVLHATATGADPCDVMFNIIAPDPDDAVRGGFSALPNAAAAASGGLITIGTGAGQLNPNGSGQLNGITMVHSGTATAGAASTITLQNTASATTDLYKGNYVLVTSGTGAGQARTITAYNGGTFVATVSRAWAVNPDATSVYAVIGNPHPALDSNLAVTTGTNSDKTGYSLSVAPPTVSQIAAGILATPANLLVTDATGRVTVGTNADKTGYSLSQAFPANFSLFSIDGSGRGKAIVDSYSSLQDPATIVWGATASSYNTALTMGAKLNGASTYGGGDTSGVTTLLARIPGTVQPQTGDSYARLGAPVGASISADVAAIPGAVWQVGTRTLTAFAFTPNVVNVTGTLPNVTVGGYAAGQDPATLLQAMTVDGTLTFKQLKAIEAAVALEGDRTFNATTHIAVLTYYRRAGGGTGPDKTKPLLTKTTTYDSSNTQVVSQTITLSNLP